VKAFYDVDPKKIGKTYRNCWTGEEIPILSTENVSPPFVICVAYDRDNEFDQRISNLPFQEGKDYWRFF
jgi:hypothetical protein